MGEYLAVEDMVFQRDDKNQLLPVDMVLKTLERKRYDPIKDENGRIIGKKEVIYKPAPKVKVIPPPRGRWLAIIKMKPEEQDKAILFEHVVEPKIDENVYAAMKPAHVGAIVKAFSFIALDITPEEVEGRTKEELTEAEEFQLQKNLNGGKGGQPSSSTNLDTTTSISPSSPIEK